MSSDDPTITAVSSSAKSSPNLRVLLVDDQDDLLLMLNLLFQRRRDYAVETANSAALAMQKASDFAPHIVVSDIGMPDMDGCELMQNLRQLEGDLLSPFKAIALSGYDVGHETRVLTSGYDAHLTKPVDFDVLLEMVDQLAQDVKNKKSGSE